MTTHVWRLLITPPQPGAWNMAIDQAIADLYPALQRPTLRFYRWEPPCVSLGISQRLDRDINVAACMARGIDIVRRPTGGRAILHDREVTYAIITATNDALVDRGTIVRSYLAISEALLVGLRRLGVEPELAPRPAHPRAKSAACFDEPGEYEITVGGRKLVGSAQARMGGVLLQHGSLLLHADSRALAELLRLPPSLGGATLDHHLIALDQALGTEPSYESVVESLVRGFESRWPVRFERGELTRAELDRAAELAREKYGNAVWTARR